ncbi:MAG TPA: hypothetical protein VFY18_05230 [Candidatus Limnocylindrales bacterium]|nr:hypothetical protein [Candidatus Limnocylindrales bacterium]
MRRTRPILVVIALAIGALGGAPGASARSFVDPTTLTPPLKPFRVCWQLGPEVQCDTGGTASIENEPADDSPCGQIYETSTEVSNSTRWYRDGLIVRRKVEESVRGTWSLSPTGDGPTVVFMRNMSWDEHFTIPGDLTSGVASTRGSVLRVPSLGSDVHESGLIVPNGDDEIHHGRISYTDEGFARLCALLVP